MVDSIKKQMTPKKFKAMELNKSKGILDDHAVRKNIATRQGNITGVPTNPKDIVNKEYVDAVIHDAVTVTDGSTIDFTLTGQDIAAETIDTAIDHDNLLNFEADEHFTEASIDHTAILNIGTNTHAQVDTHIADGTLHFLKTIEDGSAAGQLTFWDGGEWKHTETSELFWDDTNKRLGLGVIPAAGRMQINVGTNRCVIFSDDGTNAMISGVTDNVGANVPLRIQGNSIKFYFNSGIGAAQGAELRTDGDFLINGDLRVTGDPRILRNGVEYIGFYGYLKFESTNGIVFNESGNDRDTRFEGASDINLLYLDAGTDRVGIGTATPTTKFSVMEKSGMTPIGGFAIKMTNKSGSNSVAGDVVIASTGTADAVTVAGSSDTAAIGVFLDSGVADGSETWVVVSGIADVHIDGAGCALGDRIITSGGIQPNGRGSVNNTPSTAVHFQEIGHAIEVAASNANARCVLHFN